MNWKRFGVFLGEKLIAMAGFLLLPCLLLCAIAYTPVDFVRWCISPYRRDFGGKYPWMVSQTNPYFLIYNLIHRKHLPIRFYRDDTVKVACFGWFVYEDTLILPDMGWVYDEEKACWTTEENDQTVVLDEAWIQQQLNDCNRASGGEVCRQVILLCDEDEEVDAAAFAPMPDVRMMPTDPQRHLNALRKITGAEKG